MRKIKTLLLIVALTFSSVLSVDTDEDYLVNFIKSRLNYKELPAPFDSEGKTFIVPVRIIPEG